MGRGVELETRSLEPIAQTMNELVAVPAAGVEPMPDHAAVARWADDCNSENRADFTLA